MKSILQIWFYFDSFTGFLPSSCKLFVNGVPLSILLTIILKFVAIFLCLNNIQRQHVKDLAKDIP